MPLHLVQIVMKPYNAQEIVLAILILKEECCNQLQEKMALMQMEIYSYQEE